ncbi:hypothetical protein M9Y10_013232 [Tritrichomonas musculus]|uniref:Uncharacterized protein n=1 Tax=Tritrichomonas musculus TaxID=1915356 RepID=A0ABR2I7I2_9EUKA
MTLRQARILSSEAKSKNNTTISQEQNTNIKITQLPYPNIPQIDTSKTLSRSNSLSDLKNYNQMETLEQKNKFLEMLVNVYEDNSLKVNSYLVCNTTSLMNMIKLLTHADKVELVLNEDIACNSCCSSDKLIYISKILITKNNKTEDMKYAYNDVYSQFIKYGISLKIAI